MKTTTKHSYLEYSKILAWEFFVSINISVFFFQHSIFLDFQNDEIFCLFMGSREMMMMMFMLENFSAHTQKHVDYLIFFQIYIYKLNQNSSLFFFLILVFYFIHFSNKFFVVKFFSSFSYYMLFYRQFDFFSLTVTFIHKQTTSVFEHKHRDIKKLHHKNIDYLIE